MNQQLDFPVLGEPYSYTDSAEVDTEGGNILASWTQYLATGGDLQFQLYYDHSSREEVVNNEQSDTLDFEFKHHFFIGEKHDLIWGGHYRYISQQFVSSFWTSLDPEDMTQIC